MPKRTAKRHECGVLLTISFYAKNKVRITLKHNSFPETAQKKIVIFSETTQAVRQLAKSGGTPFLICSQLRSVGNEVIQYRQIYQILLDSVTSQFPTKTNPKESLTLFANKSNRLLRLFLIRSTKRIRPVSNYMLFLVQF